MQLCDGGKCLTWPHKPHLTHLVARRVSSEAAAREGGTGGRLVLYLVSSNPETKSQIRVRRGWGGWGIHCIMGTDFQFGMIKKL